MWSLFAFALSECSLISGVNKIHPCRCGSGFPLVSCLAALESSKSMKHDLKLELSFEVLLLYCWRYQASSSSLLLIDPGPSFESTVGGRNFYCLVQSEMLNMGKIRLFLGHGLWQHARWGCRRFRVLVP